MRSRTISKAQTEHRYDPLTIGASKRISDQPREILSAADSILNSLLAQY